MRCLARFRELRIGAIALFLALVSSNALAELRPLIWEQSPSVRILIPRLEHESNAQAIQRFVDGVNGVEEFRQSMNGDTLKILPETRSYPYAPERSDLRPKFGVMVNEFSQIAPDHRYALKLSEAFGNAGAQVFFIALGAEASLPEERHEEWRALVHDSVDALVLIGGRDVDPSLYGEENRAARNVRPQMDRLESAMLKMFIAYEQKVIFGICRGSQLCAVTLGHSLVQDIPTESQTQISHGDSWHDVELTNEDDSRLLKTFVRGKDRFSVRSLHHQAVKLNGDGSLRASSFSSPDGAPVVESTQSANGLLLATQFHPEAMDTDEGRGILLGIVEYAEFVRDRYNRHGVSGANPCGAFLKTRGR